MRLSVVITDVKKKTFVAFLIMARFYILNILNFTSFLPRDAAMLARSWES